MLNGTTNADKIWNFFDDIGMSPYGISGLMGNIDCESGLNPINLENQYEAMSGYNDKTYTSAVDTGSYKRFVNDGFGYGLVQWSFSTRKQKLLDFAKSRNASIGELEMQLEFIVKEMKESFPSVWNTLMHAETVLEASNAVLLKYEAPLDQSAAVQTKRASYGQAYYNRFALAQPAIQKGVNVIMGYYVIPKGLRKQLSEHFSSVEFDCHGSGCCKETRVNEKLPVLLEKIRAHFGGSAITITSAYRCTLHNSRVNGATGSRHSVGDAVDFVVAGHAPREVAAYCESIGILGIGLYETAADGYFVHIDTRDYKSFWYGQACVARTTFGGSNYQSTYQPVIQTGNSGLITYGSSGTDVKKLQENLIKLGYYCGVAGADGSFGLGTMNAVKKFQSEHKLTVDGIAGKNTLAEIDALINSKENEENAMYEVTADALNIREDASINSKRLGVIAKGSTLYITEIKDGWGKSSYGWVSLQYCQRKG